MRTFVNCLFIESEMVFISISRSVNVFLNFKLISLNKSSKACAQRLPMLLQLNSLWFNYNVWQWSFLCPGLSSRVMNRPSTYKTHRIAYIHKRFIRFAALRFRLPKAWSTFKIYMWIPHYRYMNFFSALLAMMPLSPDRAHRKTYCSFYYIPVPYTLRYTHMLHVCRYIWI